MLSGQPIATEFLELPDGVRGFFYLVLPIFDCSLTFLNRKSTPNTTLPSDSLSLLILSRYQQRCQLNSNRHSIVNMLASRKNSRITDIPN